ncbi:hypothetical protein ACFVT5_09030 [Streptomyces sp. NPDC058001]|uniref:hypothetical protein n=1 Tax=Streptomyces sp. NPDC058001 TaxID=3346300 RepID=UPI0036EF0422
MRNMFLPKSRRTALLVAHLEEELDRDRVEEVATQDGLFDQYGTDAPEYRQMSSSLRRTVLLARDKSRWAQAGGLTSAADTNRRTRAHSGTPFAR